MADFMKAVAAIGGGKAILVDDVPMQEYGDYEVLLKNRVHGFCNGTDMQIINGTMGEEEGLKPYPTLIGHESIAEIVEKGKKVRYLNIGDRYMDTKCTLPKDCKYTLTWGCSAEYHILYDIKAMEEDGVLTEQARRYWGPIRKVPKALDIDDCGVLLPLCECYSAAKNFGVNSQKDVLVYGAGPMGLAMMRFMKYFGVKSLTCIDMIDERLQKALTISGVDRVINSAKESVDDVLKDEKFDLVVDAVGLSSIILEGTKRLKPYGRVGSLGVLKQGDNVINVQRLKNNTMLHMLNFPYREHAQLGEVCGLILSEQINPKDYYSHVVDFKKVDEILDLVKSKKAIKVIMKYDD